MAWATHVLMCIYCLVALHCGHMCGHDSINRSVRLSPKNWSLNEVFWSYYSRDNCKNCGWPLMLRPRLFQLQLCIFVSNWYQLWGTHTNKTHFAVRGVHLLLGSLHILRLRSSQSFVQVLNIFQHYLHWRDPHLFCYAMSVMSKFCPGETD